MKILAFGASNSTKSINKRLVTYAVGLLKDADTEIIDLNDYELPLFSEDKEAELGKPAIAQQLLTKISLADAIIISFAEHNGGYSVAYKNIFDWCSRIEAKVFQGKPMIMLSTSPGARGGATVLATAVNSAPFFNGDVKANMAVPSFYDNFDIEKNIITDIVLKEQLYKTMMCLKP